MPSRSALLASFELLKHLTHESQACLVNGTGFQLALRGMEVVEAARSKGANLVATMHAYLEPPKQHLAWPKRIAYTSRPRKSELRALAKLQSL